MGKVGVQTKGVERMLRRVGFRYAWRVDPFDGGPHFTAPTDEVTLVQRAHSARLTKLLSSSDAPKTRALVAVERGEPPFFRAVLASWLLNGSGACIGQEAAARLAASEGDEIWILPIE